MPPTLEAMLDELAEHHLRRTVADRWQLDVPPGGDRDDLVDSLLAAMRSPDQIRDVVDRLYGDLRRVLHHLVLAGFASTTSDVAGTVFDGDLWRTKQSLEELRNYQLVHLTEAGTVQGAYPEYEVRVPDDLQDPLREALDLVPVADEEIRAAEPGTVHRGGWNLLRDAVATLALAEEGAVGRTQPGDLRKRSLDRLGEVVTDDDPRRLDLIVAALERLGVLTRQGPRLEPVPVAGEMLLEEGPARAQALILAGLVDEPVPGTASTVGEMLWTVTALAELGEGWLDAEAALSRVRHEGLRRDLDGWFARSPRDVRAFLDTVGHWTGLVDLGKGQVRLTDLGRAVVGLADPPTAEVGRVVVDPSLEVHVFQDPPDPVRLRGLLRFAEVDHLGPASSLLLTRDALWDALADGTTLDELLARLDEVPDNVETTLRDWAARHERVGLEEAWILSVRDPDLMDDLMANADLADGLDRLGPEHARVTDPDVPGYLEEAGLMTHAPTIDVGAADADEPPREVRFHEALDDLAEALDVGLPAWLAGEPRYGDAESF